MSIFIPNSYQTPNFYTDYLDQYLLPSETKVLFKAVREILGWHQSVSDRQADLSLSDFVEGSFKATGERRSFGCGLSKESVHKAIKALCQYNILQFRQRTRTGTRYFLNLDTDTIDWEGLQQRKNIRFEKNLYKTVKARSNCHGKAC